MSAKFFTDSVIVDDRKIKIYWTINFIGNSDISYRVGNKTLSNFILKDLVFVMSNDGLFRSDDVLINKIHSEFHVCTSICFLASYCDYIVLLLYRNVKTFCENF